MVSLKRSIIFSLLFLIVISTQNTIALTYLPDSSHYSGKQYLGGTGDWVTIEFAVYDNHGAEFIDEYELPWADPGEFVYAYQIMNNTTTDFTIDYFSIYGLGEGAITSSENIGSLDDHPMEPDLRGQEVVYEQAGFDLSTAHWEFIDPLNQDDPNPSRLYTGEHSYFLLVTSDQDYQAGTYNFQPPQGDDVPVPEASEPAAISNPEPCTLALFGLGSVLLLKRKK